VQIAITSTSEVLTSSLTSVPISELSALLSSAQAYRRYPPFVPFAVAINKLGAT
jgi:hypothetical protein